MVDKNKNQNAASIDEMYEQFAALDRWYLVRRFVERNHRCDDENPVTFE